MHFNFFEKYTVNNILELKEKPMISCRIKYDNVSGIHLENEDNNASEKLCNGLDSIENTNKKLSSKMDKFLSTDHGTKGTNPGRLHRTKSSKTSATATNENLDISQLNCLQSVPMNFFEKYVINNQLLLDEKPVMSCRVVLNRLDNFTLKNFKGLNERKTSMASEESVPEISRSSQLVRQCRQIRSLSERKSSEESVPEISRSSRPVRQCRQIKSYAEGQIGNSNKTKGQSEAKNNTKQKQFPKRAVKEKKGHGSDSDELFESNKKSRENGTRRYSKRESSNRPRTVKETNDHGSDSDEAIEGSTNSRENVPLRFSKRKCPNTPRAVKEKEDHDTDSDETIEGIRKSRENVTSRYSKRKTPSRPRAVKKKKVNYVDPSSSSSSSEDESEIAKENVGSGKSKAPVRSGTVKEKKGHGSDSDELFESNKKSRENGTRGYNKRETPNRPNDTKVSKENAAVGSGKRKAAVKPPAKKGTLRYLRERQKALHEMKNQLAENDDKVDPFAHLPSRKYKGLDDLFNENDMEPIEFRTPKDVRGKTAKGLTPRTAFLADMLSHTPSTLATPGPDQSLLDSKKQDNALRVMYNAAKDRKKARSVKQISTQPTFTKSWSNIQFPDIGEVPDDAGNSDSGDDYFDESL